MVTNREELERDAAIKILSNRLQKGQTVYTYLASVSRTGMSRQIGVLIAGDGYDGKPIILNISGWVADALGWKWDRNRGTLKVRGGGDGHGLPCGEQPVEGDVRRRRLRTEAPVGLSAP